jgi:hypothetical protein
MHSIVKRLLIAAVTLAVMLGAGIAKADDSPALGQQIVPESGTTVSPGADGKDAGGVTVVVGETAKGANAANAQLDKLFDAVIPAAVTLSQNLKSEADKFAAGLGVITLVLTFVRFSGTRDPTSAWVEVFEELAVLGIFAAIYISYQTFAPGFFGWFQKLAGLIQGSAGQDLKSTMAAASGSAWEAVVEAYSGANPLKYIAITMSMFPMLLAYVLLMITCIVFTFMNNLGLIQAAVGIVMGQIAVALGFSSYTRGFFKAWLDYMISAGMYCVVSAILAKLVTASLNSAIKAATAEGLSSSYGATYALDVAFFIFLLSFEIPKLASMFGGGASASGGMFKTAAQTAAKAAAFL